MAQNSPKQPNEHIKRQWNISETIGRDKTNYITPTETGTMQVGRYSSDLKVVLGHFLDNLRGQVPLITHKIGNFVKYIHFTS